MRAPEFAPGNMGQKIGIPAYALNPQTPTHGPALPKPAYALNTPTVTQNPVPQTSSNESNQSNFLKALKINLKK